MSGWFGYGRGEGSSTDAAYSRVTNAERFLPLHTAMLEIVGQLENNFEGERTEGYGLDEELERGLDLARPYVKLTPEDPDAAPVVCYPPALDRRALGPVIKTCWVGGIVQE